MGAREAGMGWGRGRRVGKLEGGGRQLGSTTLGSCQASKFPTSYLCSLSPTASSGASEEVLAASSVCLL